MTKKLSVIVPIYNNRESLPAVLNNLSVLNEKYESFEVILVDDGSHDDSSSYLLEQLKESKLDATLLLHQRNFGSFSAIKSGLRIASGDYIAVMSADLQEPIELTINLFNEIQNSEYSYVIGVREERDEPIRKVIPSKIFWVLINRFINSQIPRNGVDVFACTKSTAETLSSMNEVNSSLIVQLFWIGGKFTSVPYIRLSRPFGKSGWTFRKKLRYFFDSLFSFTNLPIVLLHTFGILGILGSIIWGTIITILRLRGEVIITGYTSLILAITSSTSLLITAIAILGSYISRTYENSKSRPFSIVKEVYKFEN